MPSQVFESKRHDTAVSPRVTFTPPADAVNWDLQEVGLVATFIARSPEEAAPKFTGACVVLGPWEVRYDPTPTDVDTIGVFDVEIEVVRPDGKKVTLPTKGFLSWVIGPDLNNA